MSESENTQTDARGDFRRGVAYAIGAYGLWGVFPLYFKAVRHVQADEILAHRVVWSVLACGLMLSWTGRWANVRAIVGSKRSLATLSASAVLIAVNWLCFIYAILNDRIIEASLGYFINPLVSILLGMVFLGERLRPAQWAAVALAGSGVVFMTYREGLPWIAITVAVTFAFYGLVRKQAKPGPLAGLFVETSLLAPIAVLYLGWLWLTPSREIVFVAGGCDDRFMLALAGLVTTLPLLWFAAAAKNLPLSALGFFQYIAPTGQFGVGLLYGEPFSTTRAVAFGLIWMGIVVFVAEAWRRNAKAAAEREPRGG